MYEVAGKLTVPSYRRKDVKGKVEGRPRQVKDVIYVSRVETGKTVLK